MIGGTLSKRGLSATSIWMELVYSTIVNVMFITVGLRSVTDPWVIVHDRIITRLGITPHLYHVTLSF